MDTTKHYGNDQKSHAVRMVVEEGKTYVEAAREIGAHNTSVRKWVLDQQSATTKPRIKSDDKELNRLRDENNALRKERDMFKTMLLALLERKD